MTSKKATGSQKSQPQAEKFKAMAKELEADGDEKTFEGKLRAIAKAEEKPAKGKR